jgi:hypothetical protein
MPSKHPKQTDRQHTNRVSDKRKIKIRKQNEEDAKKQQETDKQNREYERLLDSPPLSP